MIKLHMMSLGLAAILVSIHPLMAAEPDECKSIQVALESFNEGISTRWYMPDGETRVKPDLLALRKLTQEMRKSEDGYGRLLAKCGLESLYELRSTIFEVALHSDDWEQTTRNNLANILNDLQILSLVAENHQLGEILQQMDANAPAMMEQILVILHAYVNCEGERYLDFSKTYSATMSRDEAQDLLRASPSELAERAQVACLRKKTAG